MGNGLKFALGGALQGIGQGMALQQKLRDEERFQIALTRARESYTLGPGDVRYDASGNELARGPERAPETSNVAQQLIEAGYQPGTEPFQTKMRELIEAGATKFIPFEQGGGIGAMGPDGRPRMVVQPNPGDKTAGSPVNGGGTSSIPSAAADHLRKNPGLREDFDRKYGVGAAERVLAQGGPTSASGGFPRP